MFEASVLQIMPDLQELCLSPILPLSMEHLEMDSLVISCEGHVLPISCEQVEVPKSIVLVVPMGDVVISVASLADDVDADAMLAPDPLEPSQLLAFGDPGHVMFMHYKVNEIHFELEIYSLLKCLEAASPGSGKVLMEEALRKQSKKSGTTEKASRTS
ncbi:Gibberellin 2-beta-dioxygenase 8 [Hordeum vulgare]|nr:Gibberellin 2-beta-dioxygenase 8 [Hordeum vulgare]